MFVARDAGDLCPCRGVTSAQAKWFAPVSESSQQAQTSRLLPSCVPCVCVGMGAVSLSIIWVHITLIFWNLQMLLGVRSTSFIESGSNLLSMERTGRCVHLVWNKDPRRSGTVSLTKFKQCSTVVCAYDSATRPSILILTVWGSSQHCTCGHHPHAPGCWFCHGGRHVSSVFRVCKVRQLELESILVPTLAVWSDFPAFHLVSHSVCHFAR